MYDIVYDFILNVFLDATIHGSHNYYSELALILTHTTMILFYISLVLFIVHVFNAFRSMTRFW